MKTLTAQQIKKMPVGTIIRLVNDKTGQYGGLWIVKSGKKKMLKSLYTMIEIKDRDGFHFELEEAEQ